jgi:glycolate oxidase FAD binding subunit
MLTPTTENEVRDAVLALASVRVRGGGTKTALCADATLSTAGLRGILEYEPGEFTFTALAGTPLSEVASALAANGQYLPFDPPWVRAGATLGGTVAAGLSGSGRFQYGGVRDFLIGVRLVTGDSRVVRGGGKVVKNAAGFDIPKLMIGSLGTLGVVTEVSFKVFPAPAASATVCAEFVRLEEAVTMLERLGSSRLALAALDLMPKLKASAAAGGLPAAQLQLRLGGLRAALPERINRVRSCLEGTSGIEVVQDDVSHWEVVGEFGWAPPEHSLVKMPLTPRQILKVEACLAGLNMSVPRRYSVGGNVVWLAWPAALPWDSLDDIAGQIRRSWLLVRDSRRFTLPNSDHPFLLKLRSVFDPQGKFV